MPTPYEQALADLDAPDAPEVDNREDLPWLRGVLGRNARAGVLGGVNLIRGIPAAVELAGRNLVGAKLPEQGDPFSFYAGYRDSQAALANEAAAAATYHESLPQKIAGGAVQTLSDPTNMLPSSAAGVLARSRAALVPATEEALNKVAGKAATTAGGITTGAQSFNEAASDGKIDFSEALNALGQGVLETKLGRLGGEIGELRPLTKPAGATVKELAEDTFIKNPLQEGSTSLAQDALRAALLEHRTLTGKEAIESTAVGAGTGMAISGASNAPQALREALLNNSPAVEPDVAPVRPPAPPSTPISASPEEKARLDALWNDYQGAQPDEAITPTSGPGALTPAPGGVAPGLTPADIEALRFRDTSPVVPARTLDEDLDPQTDPRLIPDQDAGETQLAPVVNDVSPDVATETITDARLKQPDLRPNLRGELDTQTRLAPPITITPQPRSPAMTGTQIVPTLPDVKAMRVKQAQSHVDEISQRLARFKAESQAPNLTPLSRARAEMAAQQEQQALDDMRAEMAADAADNNPGMERFDALDAVGLVGGIAPPGKNAGGEYDDIRAMNPAFRRVATSKNGQPIDVVAKQVQEQYGVGDGTAVTLAKLISRAGQERQVAREGRKKKVQDAEAAYRAGVPAKKSELPPPAKPAGDTEIVDVIRGLEQRLAEAERKLAEQKAAPNPLEPQPKAQSAVPGQPAGTAPPAAPAAQQPPLAKAGGPGIQQPSVPAVPVSGMAATGRPAGNAQPVPERVAPAVEPATNQAKPAESVAPAPAPAVEPAAQPIDDLAAFDAETRRQRDQLQEKLNKARQVEGLAARSRAVEYAGKQMHGHGQTRAAERRRIVQGDQFTAAEGGMTGKELAAERTKAGGFESGRQVTYQGRKGTVTGSPVSFGKHEIQWNDGTKSRVGHQELLKENPARQTIVGAKARPVAPPAPKAAEPQPAVKEAPPAQPAADTAEARIAATFANYEQAKKDYDQLEDADGGRVLNVDTARELSKDYAENNESRGKYSGATHEPASAFIKKLFWERVKTAKPGSVMFLAGGGGSGKSTVKNGPAKDLRDQSALIVDAVLGKFAKAKEMIDGALAEGRRVSIAYVHTPFNLAVERAEGRARSSGRSVRRDVLAEAHAGANDAILRLANEYAGNPNVTIRAYDNTGATAVPMSIAQLKTQRYTPADGNVKDTETRLLAGLPEAGTGSGTGANGPANPADTRQAGSAQPEGPEATEPAAEPVKGRPDLANPAKGEQGRRFVDALDELNKDQPTAGKSRTELRDNARQRLANDRPAAVKEIEDLVLTGEQPTREQAETWRQLIDEETAKATQPGATVEQKAQAAMLVTAYRQSGSEAARILGDRADTEMTPDQRLAYVREAVLDLPQNLRSEVDRLTRAMKKRRDQEAERAQSVVPRETSNAQKGIKRARKAVDDSFRKLAKEFKSSLTGTSLNHLGTQQIDLLTKMVANRVAAGVLKFSDVVLDVVDAVREFRKNPEIHEAVEKIWNEQAASNSALDKAKVGDAEKAVADQDAEDRLIRDTERAKKGEEPERARIREIHQNWAKRQEQIKRALKEQGYDIEKNEPDWAKDPALAARVLRFIATEKKDAWDKAYEYRLASMLSGITTHAVNITSNAAHMLWDMTVQRGTEIGVNLVTRQSEGAQLGEIKHLISGMLPGLSLGMRNAIQAFREEAPVLERQIRGPEYTGKTSFDERPGAIRGKTGRVVRIPLTMLAVADDFFKSIVASMESGARAYRIAKGEGLKGQALEDRIRELHGNMRSQAWQEALGKGEEVLFQDSNGVTKAIEGVINAGRNLDPYKYESGPARAGARTAKEVTRHTIPFLRTVLSLFSKGIRKSPLGSVPLMMRLVSNGIGLMKYGKAGWTYQGDPLVRDLAEQVIAWGATLALYGMLDPDDEDPVITGSMGGYEPSKSANQKRAKVEPYTIRIGEQRYNYSRIEPFATALGLMVDGVLAVKRGDTDRVKGSLVGDMKEAVLGQIKNKTFLSGLGDLIRTLQGDDSKGNFAQNFATSWVPNVVRGSYKALDPVERDTRALSEATWTERTIRSMGVPGVPPPPPRVDLWGQPVEKMKSPIVPGPASDFLFRLMSPVKVDSAKVRPVDRAILTWNNEHPDDPWWPSIPEPTISIKGKSQKMSADDYQALLETGKVALRNIEARRFDPEKPTEDDVKAFKKEIEQARSTVRTAIRLRIERGAQATR